MSVKAEQGAGTSASPGSKEAAPLLLPEPCGPKPAETEGLNKAWNLACNMRTSWFRLKITHRTKNREDLKLDEIRQLLDISSEMTDVRLSV